jgi:SAM-dependent MidA family methyltransferase
MLSRSTFLKLAACAAVFAPGLYAQRQVSNDWEIRDEMKLPAGIDPARVRDYFPDFRDYIDTVLFHPTAGYYSSGRVDFTTHYRTFPNTLSPAFGQMLAEQIFRMWDGMRTAQTLRPAEKFTIAEFGPGNGALAESILNYIDAQAAKSSDARWRAFQQQVVYASYDRSPALSAMQHDRNSRFGARFEARIGDATNPGATIPPRSLKGVVLSNELPDCFSVHKVVLSPNGVAELVYVAPYFLEDEWPAIARNVPSAARELVEKDAAAIQKNLFTAANGQPASGTKNHFYLSRAALNAVLDAIGQRTTYEIEIRRLQFQEIYVPVSVVPDVADYFQRYANAYANRLARTGQGLVTYVNLGEGKFIRGAGAALEAGYVITIDYGDSWEGILDLQFDHLRMYGPGAAESRANPYQYPTLNDMTTDANFSHIAEEGAAAALRPLYFGPQHAIQLSTPIKLDPVPPERSVTEHDILEFKEWAGLFRSWEVYKVLVQQKQGTDPAYSYPQTFAEPLAVSEEGLTPQQFERIAEIAKQLSR